MQTPEETEQTTEKEVTKPVGIVILGKEDPRKMTLAQFLASPELLYHGSRKPLDFSQVIDERVKTDVNEAEGSQTLGLGFYTANKPELATKYSQARQFRGAIASYVSEILPYQAKMLDLRAMKNIFRNAPLPDNLVNDWVNYFSDYISKRPEPQRQDWVLYNQENDYFRYLRALVQKGAVDLREMLATSASKKLGVSSLCYPSPPWSKDFTSFIHTHGYDGVIYNEGGEDVRGSKFAGGPSFVFYDLTKIGTFDSWHKSLADSASSSGGESKRTVE